MSILPYSSRNSEPYDASLDQVRLLRETICIMENA